MSFRREARSSNDTWILVADRASARILARSPEPDAKLELVESLTCPEGAMHPRELVSDQRSYFKGRFGSLESGDLQTDFEHRTARRLAHDIALLLEEGRRQQRFGRLILVAAPAFLGALRSELSAPLARLVEAELAKDYTSCSIEEIADHLETVLQSKRQGEQEP